MNPNLGHTTDTSREPFPLVHKGKPLVGVNKTWPLIAGPDPREPLRPRAPPVGVRLQPRASRRAQLQWASGSVRRRTDQVQGPLLHERVGLAVQPRAAEPDVGVDV